MKEIFSSNNPVQLSWAQAVLSEVGIEAVVLDGHTSAVYGGALMEQRLMVIDEDEAQALRILEEAKPEA